MSAPAPRSAEAASSTSAAPAGIATPIPSAHPAGPDDSLPAIGTCWRGKYQIAEQIDTAADRPVWHGRSTEGGHEVVLRAFRCTEPELRAQAWAKVGGIDSPHLQHARDAQRAGEWRVEIADLPPGIPLPQWRAARTAVDARLVRSVVGQLAEALAALHAFELVHLGIRPEAILVSDEGTDVRCVLGGLDSLTGFDRKEPVAAPVDPFYAPPEALGLNVHVPGPGLCAWDWWSLGRVIQEFILGQHIAARLAAAETRPPSAEARARAEALLLEADSKGPRAGAVELMAGLDAQLAVLLRGLLTSAQEARWTSDNVDRWVRGLPVKDQYEARRAETHFRWRGRPCTVPEIAGTLQTSEHWTENSVQLWEATTPGTLAHFLRWSPTQAAAYEQLTSALELADSLPLKMSSAVAQREAVTMVALMQLSGARLVWRGRPFEVGVIGIMLEELGDADGLAVLRALSTRSNALQIERVDAAAGRLLTELGRTVGEVENFLRRHGWLATNDLAGSARVFRLALEPAATLRATRDGLAQQYAGSDHAAMDKLLKAANVGRSELVVLAWTAADPARHQFYTHAEAARRRAEALRTRAVELTRTLVWARLERALAAGPLVFGRWSWFVLCWVLVAGAVAVLWPGWKGAAFAAGPALVALILRMLAARRPARALREIVPDARWSWRDGPSRCRRELKLAARGVSREALTQELDQVTGELGTLKDVQPPPAPVPPLPAFQGLRTAGGLSWVLLAGCVGVAGWRARVQPPSFKAVTLAWGAAPAAAKTAVAASAVKASADGKPVNVKISWPYQPGDTPVKTPVLRTVAANSAEVASATRRGRDLVAPYRPDSIGTLIFLPVSTGDQAAVMMFDGKRGELVNEQVYVLDALPIPRSWVDIGGRDGVFLDR